MKEQFGNLTLTGLLPRSSLLVLPLRKLSSFRSELGDLRVGNRNSSTKSFQSVSECVSDSSLGG